MKLAQGPRPWPIRLFAGAWVTQALLSFGWEMMHRGSIATSLWERGGLAEGDDGTIVALSVRLTIALIPAALVWFFASPFARLMVLAITVGRLAMSFPTDLATLQPFGLPSYFHHVQLLSAIAAALLFTPTARRWFAEDKSDAVVND